MIKKAIKKHFFGKSRYQPFWERLYHWSLAGMNIGYFETELDAGELWVLDHVQKEMANNQTNVVFDVGANSGRYAVEVLGRFGKSLRIYCFEPAREPYKALSDLMSDRENVECFNFALGESEELRTLYKYSGQCEFSSLYERPLLRKVAASNGSSRKDDEQVQVKTLDWFCSTAGIDRINLLKLDVEGHELKVLRGARSLIHDGSIDFIQFEFGGTHIDSRTFICDFQELLNPGFQIYRILKDGLSLVEGFNGTHEIFVYSNFLAVSRKLAVNFS